MIKNYFITAVRNFRRHLFYSFLTVAGLSIGMTCFVLVFVNVYDEFSYDRFHSKADRICRLYSELGMPTGVRYSVALPRVITSRIRESISDIEEIVEIESLSPLMRKGSVRWKDKVFSATDWNRVSANIFRVFDLPLIEGDSATALIVPSGVVLSETYARKCFGATHVVGELVELTTQSDTSTLQVTGVMRDLPANSSLKLDMLLPQVHDAVSSGPSETEQRVSEAFVLLRDGATEQEVVRKVQKALGNHPTETTRMKVLLQPLSDIHLNRLELPIGETGKTKAVVFEAAIGFILLLIACINHINLTTARSSSRTKEIGIRKTIGAERGQIFRQFMGEALVLAACATLLCLLLAEMLLPFFNQLLGKQLELDIIDRPYLTLGIVATWIGTSLMAGTLPALILSRSEATQVLRKRSTKGFSTALLRRFLVIFQFASSLGFFVSTLVIYQELRMLQSRDVGYQKDNVFVLFSGGSTNSHSDIMYNEALKVPGVLSASRTSSVPGYSRMMINVGRFGAVRIEDAVGFDDQMIQVIETDQNFLTTMNLTTTRGRWFSGEVSGDASSGLVVNESAVRSFGWADPLGKRITIHGRTLAVIGVIKDLFWNPSVRVADPLLVCCSQSGTGLPLSSPIVVRVDPQRVDKMYERLEQTWTQLFPNTYYQWQRLGGLAYRYVRDCERLGQLLRGFAALAIMIACLGLLGLAAYTAEQRTKEIGIRKVFGATTLDIVTLFSTDYLKLVLIASLVGSPISYLIMKHWLEGFQYRTVLGPNIFLLANTVMIATALLPVAYQSAKAALTDPVESLRHE